MNMPLPRLQRAATDAHINTFEHDNEIDQLDVDLHLPAQHSQWNDSNQNETLESFDNTHPMPIPVNSQSSILQSNEIDNNQQHDNNFNDLLPSTVPLFSRIPTDCVFSSHTDEMRHLPPTTPLFVRSPTDNIIEQPDSEQLLFDSESTSVFLSTPIAPTNLTTLDLSPMSQPILDQTPVKRKSTANITNENIAPPSQYNSNLPNSPALTSSTSAPFPFSSPTSIDSTDDTGFVVLPRDPNPPAVPPRKLSFLARLKLGRTSSSSSNPSTPIVDNNPTQTAPSTSSETTDTISLPSSTSSTSSPAPAPAKESTSWWKKAGDWGKKLSDSVRSNSNSIQIATAARSLLTQVASAIDVIDETPNSPSSSSTTNSIDDIGMLIDANGDPMPTSSQQTKEK
jgi:hypothetical protein